MRTGPIAKVLLVRLDGIGDALACTPLIVALREAGHTVGVALSDRNAGVFAPGTFVARHVLERIPWPAHGSTPASTQRARSEIGAARYDVALVASEEPEAYRLAAGIRERVGFVTGWAKPLKTLWARSRLTRPVFRPASLGRARDHEVEVLFGLGRGLFDAVPTRDPAHLRPVIQGSRPSPVRSGIVLQLGTKWTALGVAPAATRAIATALAQRGARLVVSPAEADAVRELVGGLPLCIAPTLAGWKDEIDRSAIVVTPDTGAVHLAGMLGIPVVAVFAPDPSGAQVARWSPWAAPGSALFSDRLPAGTAAERVLAEIARYADG